MRTYGWNPARLARAYTIEELQRLGAQVEKAPGARAEVGGLHLFVPAARRKLDAIRWAITHRLAQSRAA